LDQAQERLDKAVARLESALENGAGNSGKQRKDLEAADRENAVLKEINRTIGQRLDSAIDRLQVALDGA